MINHDYIWKIIGSDGDHSGKFEKVFDSRFGIIWYLITHWALPTRFTIYRSKKPYNLAEPVKKVSNFRRLQQDHFCAEDAFVARLASEESELNIKAGGTD